MEITKVIIQKVYRGEGDIRALLSVNLDDMLTIHDIKLVEARGRLFLAMPSRRTSTGYADIAHPINQHLRHELEERAIAAYNACLLKGRDGYPIPWMKTKEDGEAEDENVEDENVEDEKARFVPPSDKQEALLRAALCSAMECGRLRLALPDDSFSMMDAFRSKTFEMLERIRGILDDNTLDDFQCIEKIVCLFERMGSDGGSRHDFG